MILLISNSLSPSLPLSIYFIKHSWESINDWRDAKTSLINICQSQKMKKLAYFPKQLSFRMVPTTKLLAIYHLAGAWSGSQQTIFFFTSSVHNFFLHASDGSFFSIRTKPPPKTITDQPIDYIVLKLSTKKKAWPSPDKYSDERVGMTEKIKQTSFCGYSTNRIPVRNTC